MKHGTTHEVKVSVVLCGHAYGPDSMCMDFCPFSETSSQVTMQSCVWPWLADSTIDYWNFYGKCDTRIIHYNVYLCSTLRIWEGMGPQWRRTSENQGVVDAMMQNNFMTQFKAIHHKKMYNESENTV